jgi:predicted Zn-dependent protease
MKRAIPFVCVLAVAIGALVLAQRRKPHADIGPQAVVNMVADTQREVSRLPVWATRISDPDEIRIGDEMARSYNPPAPQNDTDRAMQGYVEHVGATVAQRAHRRLPYRFHYVAEPYFINAFALPGGHVYIGQGLISQMHTEDELAAVLGHEIEHIDHYHCAERVQIEAHLRKLDLGAIGALASLPIELFQMGYSKEQETEADVEGTRLAVAASYSPYGAVRVFEAFERLRHAVESRSDTPQEEVTRVAFQTLSDYFRSHPLESERIQRIQRLIASEHWQSRTQTRPLQVTPPAPAQGLYGQ